MSDSISYKALERSTPEEIRSGRVFGVMLILVLFASVFPELPAQRLQGVLWTGLGLLVVMLPPVARVPAGWYLVALGFVLSLALGFLPRTLVSLPAWRLELESLGLDTGSRIALQPWLAAESVAGFAVTALAAVYLLGHRVQTRAHHVLMIAFSLGVAGIAVAAMTVEDKDGVFGFFPNRNHTANLLVLGAMAGMASLVQGIRLRSGWKIALPILACAFILYALFTHNISRAGILVLAVASAAWLILMGRRALGGNSGKAILLVVGTAVAVFMIADFKVKTRLTETVERFQTPETPPESVSGMAFENVSDVEKVISADARGRIFQDAFTMIRSEPWTGIGGGQFRYVSFQYRDRTNLAVPGDRITLHPESDWLWLVAESGWAAAGILAVGLAWVGIHVLSQLRQGSGRMLRAGGIVAAFAVPFHGLFDVPGHRLGLAWTAVLLLALCLRPSRNPESADAAGPSSAARLVWRLAGFLLAICGLALLRADWINQPILPSARASLLLAEAKALYDADRSASARATEEGRDYQPPAAEDPLEASLKKIEELIGIMPLEPNLHFVRGALALHFDDKPALVDRSFALQRRLLPFRADIPLEQAKAWSSTDPARAGELWQEAMDLAGFGKSPAEASAGKSATYQRILMTASSGNALADAALPLAGGDAALLALWSKRAPAALLDQRMPTLLPPMEADARSVVFQIWSKRGSKAAIQAFVAAHPELPAP